MTTNLSKEEMMAMEDTHVCGKCGSPVIRVWSAKLNSYELVCTHDRTHQGYKQKLSATRALAQGKVDELAGKGVQEIVETRYDKEPRKSPLLNKVDLGNNQLLNPDQMILMITWTEHLGLHAYLGHSCIYHGSPYITIDGYYYLLHKRQLELRIETRPLNKKERITYKVGEDDHAWIAGAFDKDGHMVNSGLGIVTQEEIEGKSDRKMDQYRAPVAHAHPQRMAEKRAEWQLLRKIVPLDAELGKKGG